MWSEVAKDRLPRRKKVGDERRAEGGWGVAGLGPWRAFRLGAGREGGRGF